MVERLVGALQAIRVTLLYVQDVCQVHPKEGNAGRVY